MKKLLLVSLALLSLPGCLSRSDNISFENEVGHFNSIKFRRVKVFGQNCILMSGAYDGLTCEWESFNNKKEQF